MSRHNGQSIVIGNGSAVVDDFELIHRKPAPKYTKLDHVRDTLRRGRMNLNALERISAGYPVSLSLIEPLAEAVEHGTLGAIREIVAERCF
jgi:hypothetical protein